MLLSLLEGEQHKVVHVWWPFMVPPVANKLTFLYAAVEDF